jgi:hypothetical protein
VVGRRPDQHIVGLSFARHDVPDHDGRGDAVRKSIDEGLGDAGDDDETVDCSWSVMVSDDYDDAVPRVAVTVEELGRRGEGLTVHLSADGARKLRSALRHALAEAGESPGE